jgi:phage baseplate assembly protein W
MAKKRFLGMQYPLIRGARGLLAQKSGVDQIKADLLQLLLTNPGERVMIPTYGTGLRKLFFEPNDAALVFQARQMIANAIIQWEPRIVVTDIQITTGIDRSLLNPRDTGEEADSILAIRISFVDPENISEIEDLALQVPIGG